jgi:hypothetical protein
MSVSKLKIGLNQIRFVESAQLTRVEQPSDHHLTIWEVFSQIFRRI